MPRRDKTGPMGQGPMTGRGLGNCRGDQGYYGRGFDDCRGNHDYYDRGRGRGFGFHHGRKNHDGFGRGFGADYRFNNQYSAEEEKLIMKDKIRYLKNRLAYFEERLSELDKDDNQNVNQ